MEKTIRIGGKDYPYYTTVMRTAKMLREHGYSFVTVGDWLDKESEVFTYAVVLHGLNASAKRRGEAVSYTEEWLDERIDMVEFAELLQFAVYVTTGRRVSDDEAPVDNGGSEGKQNQEAITPATTSTSLPSGDQGSGLAVESSTDPHLGA